ncbi:MAG: hypothetical protein Unbinned4139contig1000_5 [Prokaryotic dsDNA virus sp.]|nr:MAG: hypothetical protein Unbinned4139contig1000_5 [Prokaryotic dsDNA virus sp.]|tara:strand:- start:5816 stop:6331 length:516 start_codon:yes stop_codon:yes gene_type:complete
MSDYLKFNDNSRECVELAFDAPLEGTNQFGKKQYTYGIKPIITGEEKFSATEKLHEKIQALGAGKGDIIYIEKVKDSGINKGFAFFKVEIGESSRNEMDGMRENVPNIIEKKTPGPMHESVKKFEEQFIPKESKDNKMEVHELSMRVEKLEKIVSELWKRKENKEEEELPF